MSGTFFPPTQCHIVDDVDLQYLCCLQTKEEHVCDDVCHMGKMCVDDLRPWERVVYVCAVSAWPACNDHHVQKCEFLVFPDWLVNRQVLCGWQIKSWGCKVFSIWQSKLDFYSSAKILSSVTFMPLRCVTEYAMYTGRCAG
jgi:hypothetical protein